VTEDEVVDGLDVAGFETRAWQAQQDWVVEWLRDGDQAGQAKFRDNGTGVEWLSFWGAERGQGLYSQALRFSLEHGGAKIVADTPERDFYLDAGFVEHDDWLVATDKSASGWLKKR
jgi:hypothetical protein